MNDAQRRAMWAKEAKEKQPDTPEDSYFNEMLLTPKQHGMYGNEDIINIKQKHRLTQPRPHPLAIKSLEKIGYKYHVRY